LKYFQTLKRKEENIMTITKYDALIVDFGRATVVLATDTQITIEDSLLYPDLICILLSYRDIRKNDLHMETHVDNKEEFPLFIKLTRYGKYVYEKISSLEFKL
jgi:hypothetical protein